MNTTFVIGRHRRAGTTTVAKALAKEVNGVLLSRTGNDRSYQSFEELFNSIRGKLIENLVIDGELQEAFEEIYNLMCTHPYFDPKNVTLIGVGNIDRF